MKGVKILFIGKKQMGKKRYHQMSFTETYVEKRQVKNRFFSEINTIVNWKEIEKELEKHYSKGQDATGRKAYPALLLFKMMLLQTWYGLSDYEIEDHVKDRVSFTKFCGLRFEDDVPDHSVLSRFRKALTEKGVQEKLLALINRQLMSKGLLVKTGAIIDASITQSSRKPKGKKAYELSSESNEVLAQVNKKGVDKEGSWTKKSGRVYYGYKRHYICEEQSSYVLSVVSSTAKDHDSRYMEECLSKVELEEGTSVLADKGYYGNPNEELLKKKGLKSKIQSRAVRGRPLSIEDKKRNKAISKSRSKIERVFAGIKKWFKSDLRCRYVGLAKTHGQHVLEAICYNLKISPGIMVARAIKYDE